MDNKLIKILTHNEITMYEFVYLDSVCKGVEYPNAAQNKQVESWLRQACIDKGFLDLYGEPTEKTRKLYYTLKMAQTVRDDEQESITNEVQQKFAEWWDTFPKTDGFGPYPPSKGLLIDPAKCFTLYTDLLEEGFSSEDLLKALKVELNIRKQNSTTHNELRYMPNSFNYLSKRAFIPWLDSSNQLPNIKVNSQVYGNLS